VAGSIAGGRCGRPAHWSTRGEVAAYDCLCFALFTYTALQFPTWMCCYFRFYIFYASTMTISVAARLTEDLALPVHLNELPIKLQAWCNLQVKLCDPCLSTLEVVTTNALY